MTLLITLYDEIRLGDAERVLALLRNEPAAQIEIRINSPGGNVAEGLAIYNALKPRRGTVYVDGVAASIASLIAMAGERIVMAENALIMIHDPWTGAQGNAIELRKTADLLDKHRDAMVSAYERTGLDKAKLVSLLAEETWMNAEEALALGFADEISEPLRYAAHAPNSFSSYRNTPKELLMTSTTDTPTNSDAIQNAMQALQQRNSEINAMAEPHMHVPGVRDDVVAALSNPTVSVQDFGKSVLARLAKGRGPLGGDAGLFPDFHSSHANTDFVQAASDTLALKAGIKIDKPHAAVRDVQGMSLADMMRACVHRNGRSFDFNAQTAGGLVSAAMTTSDFPAILENTLGKALRTGFAAEPATYEAWTRKVTVPDFKDQSRVILGSAPDLLPVAEGGEYSYGSMDEDKSVPYRVGKFGRLLKFTWETLVNDDLGAFLRITQAMGQAAARAEGDAIYGTFALNAGAGPAMQGGVNLFHASHGNLAPATAELDADALGAARVLLRRQTAVGGGVMNLTPRYLLVAPEHEQAAETLLAAAARSLSQGADNALVPAWLARLELVVEARLADNAFYLLAGADSVDTYERAWLDADNGPVILEENAFESDAKTYKVRHVFGGRWLDWRGAIKVPFS